MSDPTNGDSMDLDKSSYFEANDTLTTPFKSPNVENITLKSGDPLLANDGNSSLNFMELTQLSDSLNKEVILYFNSICFKHILYLSVKRVFSFSLYLDINVWVFLVVGYELTRICCETVPLINYYFHK